MNILHLTTLDSGGAATATLRLHRALLKNGINSKVLILFRRNKLEETIYELYEENPFYVKPYFIFSKALEYGINKFKTYGKTRESSVFSSPYSFVDVTKHPLYKWADLINLHWVSYFLDYRKYFTLNKPTVWRLSDMEPFTGGCHIAFGCTNFKSNCNLCPQLKNTFFPNYAKNNLNVKIKALSDFKNLHIVGVSNWIANEAKNSKLFSSFPIEVIHNGLNIELFKRINKTESKSELNLNSKKKTILFAADDLKRFNKGLDLLVEVFKKVQNKNDYQLIVLGKGELIYDFNSIELIKLGFVSSQDQLSKIYSAVDLTIIPSRYESFNQITLESMACGTPVLAFDNSGPADIIDHKKTGFLAKAHHVESLIDGLNWIFSGEISLEELSLYSRMRVEEKFTDLIQSQKYIDLYKRILM